MQVVRFPEAVEAAVEELMPNRITDYLYDLSEKFNGFYTECHVSVSYVSQHAHGCCGGPQTSHASLSCTVTQSAHMSKWHALATSDSSLIHVLQGRCELACTVLVVQGTSLRLVL